MNREELIEEFINEFNMQDNKLNNLIESKRLKASIAFPQMIKRYGNEYEATKPLLSNSINGIEWLMKLWELGKEDDKIQEYLSTTVEAVALNPKYNSLFTNEELTNARYKLEQLGWIYPYNNIKNDSENYDYEYELQQKIIDENKKVMEEIEKIPNKTDREVIAKIRTEQGKFRERLLGKYNNRCVICGLTNTSILRGSHIKEWANSTNEERIDKYNGLLLCANHDALFDRHLISFDINGKIIISDELLDSDREILHLSNGITIEIDEQMKKYLEYHKNKM